MPKESFAVSASYGYCWDQRTVICCEFYIGSKSWLYQIIAGGVLWDDEISAFK